MPQIIRLYFDMRRTWPQIPPATCWHASCKLHNETGVFV